MTRIMELIHVRAEKGGTSFCQNLYDLLMDESVMFQLDVTAIDFFVIPRIAAELNDNNAYVLLAGPIDKDIPFMEHQLDEIEDIIRKEYEIVDIARNITPIIEAE